LAAIASITSRQRHRLAGARPRLRPGGRPGSQLGGDTRVLLSGVEPRLRFVERGRERRSGVLADAAVAQQLVEIRGPPRAHRAS
jgi:hypothetical protein